MDYIIEKSVFLCSLFGSARSSPFPFSLIRFVGASLIYRGTLVNSLSLSLHWNEQKAARKGEPRKRDLHGSQSFHWVRFTFIAARTLWEIIEGMNWIVLVLQPHWPRAQMCNLNPQVIDRFPSNMNLIEFLASSLYPRKRDCVKLGRNKSQMLKLVQSPNTPMPHFMTLYFIVHSMAWISLLLFSRTCKRRWKLGPSHCPKWIWRPIRSCSGRNSREILCRCQKVKKEMISLGCKCVLCPTAKGEEVNIPLYFSTHHGFLSLISGSTHIRNGTEVIRRRPLLLFHHFHHARRHWGICER